MATEQYQNVVIGSGEPGKLLAWHLAKQGQKTIVIEKSMLGGSCPNVACLPSKNIIHSAKAAWFANHAADFGIVHSPPTIDMAGVFRRKRQMIDGLMDLHRNLFSSSGAELVMGEGRFIEPKTVQVDLNTGGTRFLKGERVFIATGSRATLPPIPGLAESAPMTHVEALNLTRLPEHLAILGGGYIGLEFAQAMRRFGSRVTILHHGPRLLSKQDSDICDALLELMKDEGVEVLLNTNLLTVTGRSGDSVKLEIRSAEAASTLTATDILVATGRTPNTDRLNVAAAGVELDSRGFVRVDDKLVTSAPGVWAMGDCAGSPQYTHVGYDDFRVVRDNLAGRLRNTRDRLIPYCLFTDPEMAHVGLTELEAKSAGRAYRLAKLPMSLVLRTRTLGETRGYLKALIGDDDRILGFTAFGAQAGELVAVVQTAMLGNMPYTMLRDAILTHPTIAEGLNSLFSSIPAR